MPIGWLAVTWRSKSSGVVIGSHLVLPKVHPSVVA
jgi:hypothetical protein